MPAPSMFPAPGDKVCRHVGDRLRVTLERPPGDGAWRAYLRTDLGSDAVVPDEGEAWEEAARWRDLEMQADSDGFAIDVPLARTGFYRAKAYAVDGHGNKAWPAGDDLGISVHPDGARSGNTIYCAFVRMFGDTRNAQATRETLRDEQLAVFDRHGWTVIPPSGTFRDLAHQVPFIVQTLGCRILHLLPINPTPTVHAKYGRYGSPYASLDLAAVDPALAEFDRRTTPLEQFGELARTVHAHGARLFIDLAINHTGWGSRLQNDHPEWFKRTAEGDFASPGAWGVTWEDLAELDHRYPELWLELAEVFLIWCRRGVDGFRCDAGYMVPLPAWQRITGLVRREFPDTLFLLEGLGGGWHETENLLGPGGMQWAYSELFQNHSGSQVSAYLDHALATTDRVGLLVNYSETHDNERLAKRGRTWSLLRNRLCALASEQGAFGFTCGVEWLADEKLEVHQSRGLAWGAENNLVRELGRLNRLLCEHPCFLDGARVKRLSKPDDTVLLLGRKDAEGRHRVLVVANTDPDHRQRVRLPTAWVRHLGDGPVDLLGQPLHPSRADGDHFLDLPGGTVLCLAPEPWSGGDTGSRERAARARAAFATQCLERHLPLDRFGPADWRDLADLVDRGPAAFLGCLHALDPERCRANLTASLEQAVAAGHYPAVITWTRADARRVTTVPPRHWLLFDNDCPFRATVRTAGGVRQLCSIPAGERHVAACGPGLDGRAHIELSCRGTGEDVTVAEAVFLADEPAATDPCPRDGVLLLTNDRGGMARLQIDFGSVASKYDCALGANLHPTRPVDRHVLVKRVRAWADANGFLSPLAGKAITGFAADAAGGHWRFRVGAGDGRTAAIELAAWMVDGANRVHLRFQRVATGADDDALPCKVILRVDVEDRSFHRETGRNKGAEDHFRSHTQSLGSADGFRFTPANDRHLAVRCHGGHYHPGEEWSTGVPHPVEATRGQRDRGDAWSPGWIEAELAVGASATLVLDADGEAEVAGQAPAAAAAVPFPERLRAALDAYVVRRDDGRTVIAGYPWFLDWGRDTLIVARGLLAAGRDDQVGDLLTVFGRFEDGGTLPNIIHGDEVGNRDTVDAPLWYAVVAEELAARQGDAVFARTVDAGGRTIGDVLRSIAHGYRRGTANGIHVDPASGLVWSPSHFTWMDTNYPAGTPREGYPIEVQALWLRLLRLLARLDGGDWGDLAGQVEAALIARYWSARRGWLADLLIADHQTPAEQARIDGALRSNALLAVALGLVGGAPAQATVLAAARHLVVPGALRSLAPLPVEEPLPVRDGQGTLLNDPRRPYIGRYEGDEDTRRKVAYHNGTAWTWTFPAFCEALALAWPDDPLARRAARAWLASSAPLLDRGCIGHLPEVADGDAPHTDRGCDAQAWGASEAYRVWARLA